MEVPFLDLKAQYAPIRAEIDERIKKVIDNTAFILGKNVSDFEEEFARFCGRKFAIGVNSGTTALQLALIAMGIKEGDEVITVPNTFIATAAAVSMVGGKPVFVDVDPRTYNMDPSKIEEAITEKTKAIIPVHLYGQPADMDPILEIAQKHNLLVLEDACQAHGAEYKGKRVPAHRIACFSFYPGKNLGAAGEGGAVVTDDEELAQKIKILRDQGQKEKYIHVVKGINGRLEGIQGAILSVKLKQLEKWTEMRGKNAEIYNGLLNGVVETPYAAEHSKHVYHIYLIRLKKRDELQKFLKEKGVSTGLHYPIPIHLQEAYSELGLGEGSFPNAEASAKEILSLPMFPELTREQIEYVASCIKEFMSNQH